MHEPSDPTPALELVVNDVLRPRIAYLLTIIAALIGSPEDDPRVARCLMSVHAQMHALLVKNPLVDRLYSLGAVTTDSVDAIARHISHFSLAGIRAVAASA